MYLKSIFHRSVSKGKVNLVFFSLVALHFDLIKEYFIWKAFWNIINIKHSLFFQIHELLYEDKSWSHWQNDRSTDANSVYNQLVWKSFMTEWPSSRDFVQTLELEPFWSWGNAFTNSSQFTVFQSVFVSTFIFFSFSCSVACAIRSVLGSQDIHRFLQKQLADRMGWFSL